MEIITTPYHIRHYYPNLNFVDMFKEKIMELYQILNDDEKSKQKLFEETTTKLFLETAEKDLKYVFNQRISSINSYPVWEDIPVIMPFPRYYRNATFSRY